MKPHGPIIAAVLFAVLVVGWGFYATQKTEGPADTQALERTDTDTDGDGIADWEENLIGFNPNSKDSDGDGVDDKTALLQARAILQGDTPETATSTEALTKTDILARELIGAYIQAKQFGEYDSELFKEIVAVSAKNQFAEEIPIYTEADIPVVPPGMRVGESYITNVRTLLEPLTQVPEYELETYGRAVSTNSVADYETLATQSTLYKKTADALLTIDVPKDAVAIHLELVNGLSSFSHALSLLSTTGQDPAQAFAAIRLFLESEERVRAAFAGISVYQVITTEL